MCSFSRILVVTPNYPIKGDPVYPFVKNLCEQFSRIGFEVFVVSPQSITSTLRHHKKFRPIEWIDEFDGKIIKVYQPYYLSVPFRFHDINNALIRFCLKRFFKTHFLSVDLVYSHFWSSAYAILPFAREINIPLFVATGESDIEKLFSTRFGLKQLNDYVKGVVCVSSKNREESIQLGLTTMSKCKVFPNAVNSELFHKRSQKECRAHLGLPDNEFIVAFVGWFIDRKGPQRVAQAINMIDGVKSIFIGKGDQDPQCEGILFKGSLSHEDIPIYLGAADVFVLPTQKEGCCNAVIEAMACGLPIISSNLPFNWDVLDNSNSILINPNNVDEIANAIQELKNHPEKRAILAEGALKKAQSLTIDKRAIAIINFMQNLI